MSDEGKRTPIPLFKLAREVAVPTPASPMAPGGSAQLFSGLRGEAPGQSADLTRILALPGRDPLDLKSARADAMVQLINERYSNGRPADSGCECRRIDPRRFLNGAVGCITSVLPLQAWALFEMGIAGGCIGSLPVGSGKTALDVLGIFPLNAKRAIALVPSNLLEQFWDDYRIIAEHFRVPSVYIEGIKKGRVYPGEPELRVLPYGHLALPKNSDYIDKYAPDAIIVDEIDKLANIRGSATARRTLGYYVRATDLGKRIAFAGWTGSLTNKHIDEYTHCIVMALKENAPVPLDPREVVVWGGAIDVSDMPAPIGALRALCKPEDFLLGSDTRAVRRAYGRRLSRTLGVLMVSENEVEVTDSTGIVKGSRVDVAFEERKAPAIPPIIEKALEYARKNIRPDKELGFSDYNDEIDSPIERARVVSEIVSGVMNVWEFWPTTPDRKKFVTYKCAGCKQFKASCGACIQRSIEQGGVPQENAVIDEWYAIRKDWNASVREQTLLGVPRFDSPKLCDDAAARFYGFLPKQDGFPEWENPIWPEWNRIRKLVKPQAVAKRLDPYLVLDAIKWGQEHKGVIWYDIVEFGRWVHELSGGTIPLYGGGKAAANRLKSESGERAILASLDSHGRGRNGLQFLFSKQLITQIPASARRWEQLLGRIVRRGQRAGAVLTYLYLHVPELREAIASALASAEYVEDTMLMQQKLSTGWHKHMQK